VAGVGSDTIRGMDNNPAYTYNYGVEFNSKTAVVSQAGMDGGDGGWAVLYGADPVSPGTGLLNIAIDEDQIANNERRHTTEQVAYFIIDPPAVDLGLIADDSSDHDSGEIVRPEIWRHLNVEILDRIDGPAMVENQNSGVKSHLQVVEDSNEMSLSSDQFFEEHRSFWMDGDFDRSRDELKRQEGVELETVGLDEFFGSGLFDAFA
jgi:hypothetical protein